MKRFLNCLTALALGCLAPILILISAGAALYHWRKDTKVFKLALPDLSCSVDNDCPTGYVCLSGRCIPQI